MSGVHLAGARVLTGAQVLELHFADDSGAPIYVTGVRNNNLQSIATNCSGGTSFTATFGGQTTTALAPRTRPLTLQAALEALSTVGVGNVLVSGFGPYSVEFIGARGGASQPAITTTPSGLLGDLPSSGSTLGNTGVAVDAVIGATFSITGSGWAPGFSSQGTNWYGVLNPGTGLNYAHWTIGGLGTGTYAVCMLAVDPTQGNSLAAPNNVNSIVGTLMRVHIYDGTIYRGSPTVNPRQSNGHGYSQFASVLCTTGTLHVYAADDADTGGALFAGSVYANPAYTQLDYYRPANSAPPGWPYGAAPHSVALQFKCPAIAGNKILFHYGCSNSTTGDFLYINAAGLLTFGDGGLRTVTGSDTLVTGTTYTVAYSTDGTTNVGRLYVNGVFQTLSPNNDFTPGPLQTGTNAHGAIGMITLGTSGWTNLDSTIGRVVVWDRILTGPEQLAYHNAGAPPAFAGLAGVLSTLASGVVSAYDMDPTNPGHDSGPAAVDFYAYYGPTPVEYYASPAMPVTTTQTGGALPIAVTGPHAGATLGASPLWVSGLDPFHQRDWLAFTISAALSQLDSVTISIAAGQVVTSNGALGAVTNFPVVNSAGLPVLPTTPKAGRTTKVGYNVNVNAWFEGLQPYSNLLMGSGGWRISGAAGPLTYGIDGYPSATFPSGTIEIKKWCSYSNPSGADPAGEPLQPFGNYTLLWDGPETGITLANYARPGGQLVGGQTVISTQVGSTVMGPANVGNKAVFSFPPGHEQSETAPNPVLYDPYLEIRWPVHSPFRAAGNMKLYPPNVDAANPPKFNPSVLAQLAGSKVFRTMTWFGINGCPVTDYGDFLTDGEVPGPQRTTYVTISHFDPYPYSTSNVYSRPANGGWGGIALKVTTATPHGFKTGTTGAFFHLDGITPYGSFSDGGSGCSTDLNPGPTVYVLNATTFVWTAPTNSFTGFAPSDMQFLHTPIAYSFVDACLFNNAIGPDCVLWHNVPHGATDACVTKMGVDAAATLLPGNEVVLEYENEPWNTGLAFTQTFFNITMAVAGRHLTNVSTPPNPFGTTYGLGPRELTDVEFYLLRAAQVRALFQAAWTGAGRTEPVRLVLNSRTGDPGRTQAYLTAAASMDLNGKRAAGTVTAADGTLGSADSGYAGPINLRGDGVCTAPYYAIQPRQDPTDGGSPVLDHTFIDSLTFEQYMDVTRLNFTRPTFNPWYFEPKDQLAAIRGHSNPDSASMFLAHYEGGPGFCGLYDLSAQQQKNSLAHPFHPDHYLEYLAYLKSMDDNGVKYFAQFGYAFGYGPEGTGSGGANTLFPNYSSWIGINHDAVRGDGSDGLANSLVSGLLSDASTKKAVVPALLGMGAPGVAPVKTVGSVRGLAIRVWNAGLVAAAGAGPLRKVVPHMLGRYRSMKYRRGR